MLMDEFQGELNRLEKNFKRQYTPDAATIMWRRLKTYPIGAMKLAVENLVVEEKYFPTYKEIKGALDRIMSCSNNLKMIVDPKKATTRVNCYRCEDTGIQLRRYRQDLAKDFYCSCPASNGLTKHDWSTGSWNVALKANGTARFAAKFAKAFSDDPATRKDLKRDVMHALEHPEEFIPDLEDIPF